MDHIALADLSFTERHKGAGSFYSGLYYPRKKLSGEMALGGDRQWQAGGPVLSCYRLRLF